MNESMNAHDQIAGVEWWRWLDRRLSRRSFAVAVLASRIDPHLYEVVYLYDQAGS